MKPTYPNKKKHNRTKKLHKLNSTQILFLKDCINYSSAKKLLINYYSVTRVSIVNLLQRCWLYMKSALVAMEHSHNYLYVHHNQSLLYNTTTDATKKTVLAASDHPFIHH